MTEALRLARRGRRLIPLGEWGEPLVATWEATRDAQRICEYWQRWPWCQWGAVHGQRGYRRVTPIADLSD